MIGTHAQKEGVKPVKEFLKFVFSAYKMPNKDFLELMGNTKNYLSDMLEEANSLFIAKLSVYLRLNVGCHPILYIIAATLSKNIISRNWSKYYYSAITKTPSDIIGIISYVKKNNMPVTNAMKKGFAISFEKFSAKEFAAAQKKYTEISLIDVVNIIHPRHNENLKKVTAGELPEINYSCDNPIDSKFLSELETTFEKNPKKIIDDICEIKFS
jgi:hypothetical protein